MLFSSGSWNLESSIFCSLSQTRPIWGELFGVLCWSHFPLDFQRLPILSCYMMSCWNGLIGPSGNSWPTPCKPNGSARSTCTWPSSRTLTEARWAAPPTCGPTHGYCVGVTFPPLFFYSHSCSVWMFLRQESNWTCSFRPMPQPHQL